MTPVNVLVGTFLVGEGRYLVKVVPEEQVRTKFFADREVYTQAGGTEESTLCFALAHLVARITGPEIDKEERAVPEQVAAEQNITRYVVAVAREGVVQSHTQSQALDAGGAIAPEQVYVEGREVVPGHIDRGAHFGSQGKGFYLFLCPDVREVTLSHDILGVALFKSGSRLLCSSCLHKAAG